MDTQQFNDFIVLPIKDQHDLLDKYALLIQCVIHAEAIEKELPDEKGWKQSKIESYKYELICENGEKLFTCHIATFMFIYLLAQARACNPEGGSGEAIRAKAEARADRFSTGESAERYAKAMHRRRDFAIFDFWKEKGCHATYNAVRIQINKMANMNKKG